MNYELARQLKDVGFPQKREDGRLLNGHYIVDGKEPCYTPSLSELIEACKLSEFCLRRRQGGDWQAGVLETFDKEMPVDFCEYGSTPEEAVTRLWLELNKND